MKNLSGSRGVTELYYVRNYTYYKNIHDVYLIHDPNASLILNVNGLEV